MLVIHYDEMLLDVLVQVPLRLRLVLELILASELDERAAQLLVFGKLRGLVLAHQQVRVDVERGQLLDAASHDVGALGFLLRDLPAGEVVGENVAVPMQLGIVDGAAGVLASATAPLGIGLRGLCDLLQPRLHAVAAESVAARG
jgi:hypothetical protein